MIKQLSNSVIAKYCDLSMSRRSIICLSLRLRQIIDLLATDKSQYFAQPRPIIVKSQYIGSYNSASCGDNGGNVSTVIVQAYVAYRTQSSRRYGLVFTCCDVWMCLDILEANKATL